MSEMVETVESCDEGFVASGQGADARRSETLDMYERLDGVLSVTPQVPINTKEDLARLYTPGVSEVAELLARAPELKGRYTSSGKTIGVVTDGSAVLGLGNIGPAGGLPVVEAKALLHKSLGGTDAFPITVDPWSTDELVRTIESISGSFAMIHLEDIAAPRCFEVERRLADDLDIPIYHDDQEGSAIVALAALVNAAKVVGKELTELSVVICGVGAAGVATGRLLAAAGILNVTLVDREGVVTPSSAWANDYQRELAEKMVYARPVFTLADAMRGADVFIGLSEGGALPQEYVATMAPDAIVMALANPVPEIEPDLARAAGARITATGSSKYPNQVNNILVFPGMGKGLVGSGVRRLTPEMELAVADAIAGLVDEPGEEAILPDVLDGRVVPTVAAAVAAFAE